MDCLEFRRRLGAEPRSHDAELLAHREACAACMTAWERAQRFEQALLGALEVPVPEGLADRVLLAQATGVRQRATRHRRVALGLAASLLIALGGAGVFWRQAQANALPALAVAHMPDEITSLQLTRPIGTTAVAAVFAHRHVALKGPLPADTTYVHACGVGPYHAVHLVSRHDDESVAVLYMPGKQTRTRRDFQRDGWSGREVPLQHGTLVMLTDQGSRRPFDAIEQGWRVAIDGLGDNRVTEL